MSTQEIHIYYLDVRQFNVDHYAEAEGSMSDEEHARAQKLVNGRELYIASRWLLRNVLSRCLGLAPVAIEFVRADKGKPYLKQNEINFSLSHSGHWALLAVSRLELFGVDIEAATLTDAQDINSIARNFYHPKEYANLKALTGKAQTDYFYRLWTLKESFFKALGVGISEEMANLLLDFTGNGISCSIAGKLNQDISCWQFLERLLDGQSYCALAYKSHLPVNVYWHDAISS